MTSEGCGREIYGRAIRRAGLKFPVRIAERRNDSIVNSGLFCRSRLLPTFLQHGKMEERMPVIGLQEKTIALKGTAASYLFENSAIGLEETRFHRIVIPLEAFDSGLEYEEQPVRTKIAFEWYALNLDDPARLDGLNLSHENYPDAEASVYIGWSHNRCDVLRLSFRKIGMDEYQVSGELHIRFEEERIAVDEPFNFTTTVVYG